MNSKPQLSIIIVTWNTAQITCQSIQTIHQYLTGHISYEIIVIDNASTDDSVSKISAIGRSAFGGKKLKLIINSQNLGFAKANNIGARLATADYLLFLNSDIRLIDSSLLSMLHYLQKHPHIGAIGPQFLHPDLSPQASVFPPQTLANAFKEYYLGQKHAFSKYLPTTSHPLAVDSISGGAILIKKNIFQQIGLWDERYFFYYEDLELCRQIRKQGYQIFYYPQAKIIHYHGISGAKLANNQNQWRRLIPSSKIYHGHFRHYLLTLMLWLSQKLKLS